MSKCKWENGEIKPCMILKANEYYFKNGSVRIMNSDPLSFCPFCGSLLENPVVVEVGTFGYFWDDKDDMGDIDGCWDELGIIRDNHNYPYKTIHGSIFAYFKPGLPEGYNQDGTVKDESM